MREHEHLLLREYRVSTMSDTASITTLDAAKAVASEFGVTVFLIVFGLAITQADNTWYFFIERDPTLSMRANAGSTVSNTMLVVYGIIIPGALLILLTPLLARRAGGALATSVSAQIRLCLTLLLGLAQAIGVSLVGVNVIKIVTSRPRPGFFDLCNYAGYHDALASGPIGSNTPAWTAYLSATTEGAVGDVSKCKDQTDLWDTLRSFPSGHAGISFAGLVFLTLVLRWAARVPRGVWFSPSALLSCWPVVLAAWVAVTRIHDGKHGPVDISVGATIGTIGAAMAWSQFTAVPGRDPMPLLVVVPHASTGGRQAGSAAEEDEPSKRAVAGGGGKAPVLGGGGDGGSELRPAAV